VARIRTVKPELFEHEELFDLEKETGLPVRLAFIGLFTCCDRNGRFKWRARTLKKGIMPHDEIDFSRVLDALTTRGFVRKYACGTEIYGEIPTWSKHQVINNRESESDIPAPEESSYISMTSTREARVDDASVTRSQSCQGEGKGREGKGKEEEGNGTEGKEIVVDQNQADDVRKIFEYWQRIMESPRSALDDKRKRVIAKALKSYSPADICKAIRGCSKTPHNMGQNEAKTKYNGLDLILRDADHIDRFIRNDAGQARASAASESIEETNQRVMAELLGSANDPFTIDMGAA
jgi:hypothetical protein